MLLLNMIHQKKSSFWMRKSDIKNLSTLYKLEKSDLDDFLTFFTTFGSILYMDDVVTLTEYVILDIVEFVEKVHELYHSEEKTAKYGLYKHRSEEHWRVIFDFLTALGIATEVKSNQIIQQHLQLDIASTYYYIPTSRKVFASNTDLSWVPCDDTDVHLLEPDRYTCTKETLQACLCKHLLVNKRFSLIPTVSAYETTIRFCDENQQMHDIKFFNDGCQLVMRLINQEDRRNITLQSIFPNPTCPFLKATANIPRQKLIANVRDVEDTCRRRITVLKGRYMYVAYITIIVMITELNNAQIVPIAVIL